MQERINDWIIYGALNVVCGILDRPKGFTNFQCLLYVSRIAEKGISINNHNGTYQKLGKSTFCNFRRAIKYSFATSTHQIMKQFIKVAPKDG